MRLVFGSTILRFAQNSLGLKWVKIDCNTASHQEALNCPANQDRLAHRQAFLDKLVIEVAAVSSESRNALFTSSQNGVSGI